MIMYLPYHSVDNDNEAIEYVKLHYSLSAL